MQYITLVPALGAFFVEDMLYGKYLFLRFKSFNNGDAVGNLIKSMRFYRFDDAGSRSYTPSSQPHDIMRSLSRLHIYQLLFGRNSLSPHVEQTGYYVTSLMWFNAHWCVNPFAIITSSYRGRKGSISIQLHLVVGHFNNEPILTG